MRWSGFHGLEFDLQLFLDLAKFIRVSETTTSECAFSLAYDVQT